MRNLRHAVVERPEKVPSLNGKKGGLLHSELIL